MPAVQKAAPETGSGYKTTQVRPLAGALGALITGVDLRDRANKAMWAELHRAFLEFQVIAIRGQDLSPADQYEVGRFFGEPCFYPFAKGMDGRFDDMNANWKGKGLWSTFSDRAATHIEGGKGQMSKVVHFQLRPDPLAK